MARDTAHTAGPSRTEVAAEDEIDANLRRMFAQDVEEDLSSELAALLDRLDSVEIPPEFFQEKESGS